MEADQFDHATGGGPRWRYGAVSVLLTVLGVVASIALSIPAFAFPKWSVEFLVSAVLLSELGTPPA